MADFPPHWQHVRDLPEGGQGHTFVVRRAEVGDTKLYVLKRLKNPNRKDYFEREIQVCTTLDHPNILKVVEFGATPRGKPYLITEYCEGGSLKPDKFFEDPGLGLRFFQEIVGGVAYAHRHIPPVFHLDLKPENILLRGARPVAGDFGICFVDDQDCQLTSEGPRGSMYYCAPELRGPKIAGDPSLAAADVYSLGKVLYWLFTGDVYDGHEEDYGNVSGRKLASRFPAQPEFAFVDELIGEMVRRNPAKRIADGETLFDRVEQIVDRIQAGGHVLDLRVPQKCLYCANGHYRPAHEQIATPGWRGKLTFPDVAQRRVREDAPLPDQSKYMPLREVQRNLFYASPHLGLGIPLELICDYCGNVQYFRLDLTQDGHGENWRP